MHVVTLGCLISFFLLQREIKTERRSVAPTSRHWTRNENIKKEEGENRRSSWHIQDPESPGKHVLNAKEKLLVRNDVLASSISRMGSWAVLSGEGQERGVRRLECTAKIKIAAQLMAALTSVAGTGVRRSAAPSSPCSPFSVGQTALPNEAKVSALKGKV